MNCFLFFFMITLTVATINPDDDDPDDKNPYDLSYKEIVKLVDSCNSLKEENEKFKDEITGTKETVQIILAILADQATDKVRIEHCGLISSLADESITASSIYSDWHHYYGTQHSRLNTGSGLGGWLPYRPYEGSWIEIDMGTKKTVKGVATQGASRSDHPYWVKSFTIGFKTSTSSSFQYIQDQTGRKKIFQGNTDGDTVKVNDVDVEARIIRIYPISWEDYPMLRFDVLLC